MLDPEPRPAARGSRRRAASRASDRGRRLFEPKSTFSSWSSRVTIDAGSPVTVDVEWCLVGTSASCLSLRVWKSKSEKRGVSRMGVFDERVVIVTGAARGLGRDYARYFAQDGASVVLADVKDTRAAA